MIQKIGITVRHSLSGKLKGEFFKILQLLKKREKTIVLCPLAKKLVKNSPEFSDLPEIFGEISGLDLFLFFGGDGTLLKTVNTYAPEIFSIPLFGVNAGNVGFFSSLVPENMERGFDEIFSGKFSLDERMVLEIEISGKTQKKTKVLYALNEAVIHHNKIARLRKITTKISNELLTEYKADGLIVSTPTGSTAYNLSAGGPIVAVQMDAFIITPLAPSGFSQRPIVIPPEKILDFQVDGDMLLSVDGQEYFTISADDTIQITQHKTQLRFLRLAEESYYKNIREKLGWGKG